MEGLPSAVNAAYLSLCEYSEQRMVNPVCKDLRNSPPQ